MTINPRKAWRMMAAAGCVFLGTTAVAQNQQSDDAEQRQNQSQDENRDASRKQDRQDQARDQSDQQNDQSDQQNQNRQSSEDSSQSSRRAGEPWNERSRSEAQRADQSERWSDRGSSSRQYSSDEEFGQQEYTRRGFDQQDSGQAGLGVSFSTEDDRPVIRQVHSGSPAEEMGLRRGDRITHVNGEEVATARDVIDEVGRSEPGDDIEIEVTRDGDDRSFEGELETRREALVFRGERGRQRGFGDPYATAWNSDRSVRRSYSMRGGDYDRDQYGQGGYGQQDVNRQLDSLERQVLQIHREIDRLRRSLDGRSDSYSGSETQAGYSEYGSNRGDEVRTSYSYEGGQAPDDRFDGRTYRDGYGDRDRNRGQEADQDDSPGGVVGGARTRPESDWIDNQ